MCIFARSMKKIADFLAKPFFHDYRTLFGLWMMLPIIMWLAKMTRANNYLIYRGAYWNAVRGWNLYLPNPEEYGDSHHYGPLFSLLFAPFAIGPKWLGLLLWGIALTLFLYWAIRKSQFTKYQQIFILWFCAHEMLTALFMQQFNIAIAATILLGFLLFLQAQRETDWITGILGCGVFPATHAILSWLGLYHQPVSRVVPLIGAEERFECRVYHAEHLTFGYGTSCDRLAVQQPVAHHPRYAVVCSALSAHRTI